MADDPWAAYRAPAATPAPAPTASSGDDPWAAYRASTPASTKTNPDLDYSNSPWSAAARTLAESASLGGGDLAYSRLTGKSLQGEQAKTAAASASLPWYERMPLEIAGYGLGAGALLSGIPEAAGIGGVGAMALEGGLAGGTSAALHSGGDMSLGNILPAAAGGAALGGAAGLIPKGVNAGLGKVLGKAGAVDPAAAIASTAKDTADAYAALHQKPADPTAIDKAIGGVMNNLDPSVETGMSPGLRSTINNIRNTVQGLPEANMGQTDSWQRQINAAARREAHPTDQIVAGKIDSALSGVINDGGAGQMQKDAQAAFQKSTMAQNLAEWQRKTAAGAPLGQAPLTEAETYYQGKPQYGDLADLYATSQDHGMSAWLPAHIAGAGLSAIGGSIAGFPGAFAGELGGLALKPAIGRVMKKMSQGRTQKAIQQLYPSTTGVLPTGGVQAPQLPAKTGDLLKTLMLGGAY